MNSPIIAILECTSFFRSPGSHTNQFNLISASESARQVPSTRYVTVSMIVFARGLVVSPYARDMSSMIFTNTYRPDTSSGRRILTLCCMTEEHDLSARALPSGD